MDREIKTFRWQEWINGGWVKMEIQDGQTVHHSGGYAHDEGYSKHWESWDREGNIIYYTYESQSCDCDGRLDSMSEAWVDITTPEYNEEGRLKWNRGRCFNRDYTAEAMGY